MKDIVREKLLNVINDIDCGAKPETVKQKILAIIDDYDGFRKVAEYMSEMVESLQKTINDFKTEKEKPLEETKDAVA